MKTEPYNPSPIGNPSVLARRNWWQTKLVILIGKHTPKCNEMVRILSKSMDKPLPLSMRIKKRFHFLICCWCQRYEEQLHYLRDVSRSFPEHADEGVDTSLSPAAKDRWKNALRNAPVCADSACAADLGLESNREMFDESRPLPRSGWGPWNLPLVAMAMLLLLFALRPLWSPSSSKHMLADFRSDMVSLIGSEPGLDFKASNLSDINDWLRASGSKADFRVPQNVASHSTVGCRVLSFEGHAVTLVCFRRDQGGLIHLFVVEGSAIPGLPDRQHAEVAAEQRGWTTAAWADTNHDYLLAVQADQAAIANLLGNH